MAERLMEAEAEITRLRQERDRWIDYTTDLQRIIEALCDRRGLPEPVSTARHHYNMAKEFLEAKALSRTDAVKVTEAMVEAAAKAVARRWGRDVVWEEDEVVARVALKAAMEAGR